MEPFHRVQATRWTPYGKDRLYVTTEDGQRVGWLDLLTGESTLEVPELTDAVHEAVNALQRASGLQAPANASRHGLSGPPLRCCGPSRRR